MREALSAVVTAVILAVSLQDRGAGRTLAVRVPPNSTCPPDAALIATLRGELPRWEVGPATGNEVGLAVEVTPDGAGRLTLRLVDHGRAVQQRAIDFAPSNCSDLARTIALIVKVWVRALPGVPVGEGSSAARPHSPAPIARPTSPEPPAAPSPAPVAALPTTVATVPVMPVEATSEPPPVSPAVPPAAPIPPPSPEPTAPSRGVATQPVPSAPPPPQLVAEAPPPEIDAGALVALVQTSSPPLVSAPDPERSFALPPWHLELLAGGGALGASSTFPVEPTAGLRVDLGLGDRFGAQVWGNWDGSLSSNMPGPGTVSVSRESFGLELRVTFHPRASTASRIVILGGPTLQRLDATSARYSTDLTATPVDPGLEVGALWMESIAGRFSLWAGPMGRFWFSADSFQVEEGSQSITALTSPRLWAGAVAGIAYGVH